MFNMFGRAVWSDMFKKPHHRVNIGKCHPASKFLECIRDAYLYQHVKEPTRVRENNEPSTLDLVLTYEENLVENINYDPGLGKSDHLTLSFEYTCFTTTDPDVGF